jgi:hypothetical protein
VPPRTAFHFVVCRAVSNAKRNGDFGFKKSGWPSGRGCRSFSNQADTDRFNFDNIAKQRNLHDKGKALAKALGDAIRFGSACPRLVGAAPSGLAGIGNKDSR